MLNLNHETIVVEPNPKPSAVIFAVPTIDVRDVTCIVSRFEVVFASGNSETFIEASLMRRSAFTYRSGRFRKRPFSRCVGKYG
jgi:hypothetical protein